MNYNNIAKEFPSLSLEDLERLIPREPILVCYRGSQAHGTFVPSNQEGIDDVDIATCYIPEIDHYFGLAGLKMSGTDIKVNEFDGAAYEIRHLVKLLCQANPNVLSMLWTEKYIHLSDEGRWLIKHRNLFSTKVAADSFTGYMHSQIKRMTEWHEQGENTCCDGETFHTEECKLRLSKGRGSHKKFATGHMGAKRKSLVEKFGYDTKNAAHAIRLGRMGIEFLKTGELLVKRPDFEELIAIKKGEWSLEKCKSESESLFAQLKEARESSPLPDKPDMLAVNQILVDILLDHMGANS